MQRFFDFVFSSLALIIISPLLIIVIFALKITGEGEIFFVQSRIGVQGNKFNLLKFATMLKDSPNMSLGTVTTKNDPIKADQVIVITVIVEEYRRLWC